MTTDLPHQLTRVIDIRARPELVFSFLSETARWAMWWGPGSTIDPRPGGRVVIRYPNDVEVSGEVVEIRPPETLVLTYGYASGQPIPPGASRVTIRLEAIPDGTRLHFAHALADASVRDAHAQGWRYQLSIFGNLVSDEVARDLGRYVDGWFTAWHEPDATVRAAQLAEVAVPDVRFSDRYSCVAGLDDLVPHIGAMQHYVGGRFVRRGDVRHCQGLAMVEWTAVGADNKQLGEGTNVFRLDQDGRIASVVGFWAGS